MSSTPQYYSIFNKFNFERKPVGVKFLMTRPEGIERLGKELNFCEMLREAQEGSSFYVGKEDFQCIEKMLLGMEEPEPALVGGLVGETDGLFQEARANRKMYQYLPRMLKGSVNFVAFSPVDRISFSPDVLVITRTERRNEYHHYRTWSRNAGCTGITGRSDTYLRTLEPDSHNDGKFTADELGAC